MRNIKLTLEYDGTNYVGWQIQENGPSIQGELERALRQIVQEEVRAIGAGRTDSGVHAKGQVANFRLNNPIDPAALHKGLNAVLPPDIAILSAEEVDETFHARNSAKGRVYRYVLSLQPTALERNYSWYVGGYRLEIELMNECARMIVGDHNFTSFCKAEAGVDHHRCCVEKAQWHRSGPQLTFEIAANRFLHGMVRTLVGTMVEIGRGYRPFEEFQNIMDAKHRRAAGMAAPPRGLFLEMIIY